MRSYEEEMKEFDVEDTGINEEEETCTMEGVQHCDMLGTLLGYTITDWDGSDEIENHNGNVIYVDDEGCITDTDECPE